MKKIVRARKRLILRTIQLSIAVLLTFVTLSPLLGRIGNNDSVIATLDGGASIDISLDHQEDVGVFYKNQGQISDSSIHYYAVIDGGYIGFGADRITLWSANSPPHDLLDFGKSKYLDPVGIEESDHVTNYYLGSRGTFTNVRSYDAVLYEEMFPRIDLMFGNPSTGIICDVSFENGFGHTEASEMFKVSDRFEWTEEEGIIASENLKRFKLQSRSDGEFRLSQDHEVFLSGCIGGGDRDDALAITRDVDGNIYVTGKTSSFDFPAVNELMAWQGGDDLFVTKMDQDGIVEYSTYIGGGVATMIGAHPDEVGNDITVDADGNVYITGNTKSDDFPTVNPMFSWPENNSILRGEYNEAEGDAFVLKLNSTGDIEYSTLFGGTNGDVGTSISLDGSGNIYIAGRTSSDVFPLANEIDSLNNIGNYDGFVSCISADGQNLLFSTFIGGSQDETVNDIAIDDSGSIIVTGHTSGGLSIINAFQTTYGGGTLDAFVLKIDSGWNEVYSTYLGGNDRDQGLSVCVESSGIAYITGETLSADFPLQSSLYDDYGGSGDCFITAISAGGLDLVSSSFVGGEASDIGICVDIDTEGNVVVAGTTYSNDFPGTIGGTNGGGDVFIFKTNLTEVLYSTYAGGSQNDEGRSMVVDSENRILVCGRTRSPDFPDSGLQTYNGNYDAFVYAIRPSAIWNPPPPPPPPSIPMEIVVTTSALSVIALSSLVLFVRRRIKLKGYEVVMSATAGPVESPQWRYPTDYPDGSIEPEKPVPQWNYPTDHPDGGLDPEKPVPQWNQPTDHPDGGLDPEKPVPQWNQPTDHPDGGLDPDSPAREWRTLTDYPEGSPEPLSLDQPISHLADHPEGCICPLCSPDRYVEPTPEDIAERSQKKSKKRSSDD